MSAKVWFSKSYLIGKSKNLPGTNGHSDKNQLPEEQPSGIKPG
jgi:hypothetical protein